MNKERLTKELLENWQVPGRKSKEEVWNSIQSRIAVEETASGARVVSIRRKAVWASVAAVAVIALGVAIFMPRVEKVEFVQLSLQPDPFVLPDGSKIWLHAQSKAWYDKNAWEEGRAVHLSGEGYFEVTKGSRFEVHTDKGVVSVLGTSFDVYQRNNGFDVVCYTGKVGVDDEDESVVLTPGQRIHASGSVLGDVLLTEGTEPDWKSGYYEFHNEDAARIFEEIELQFGCNIEWPTTLNKRSTCEFSNENLQEALMIVCVSMGLEFEIDKQLNVTVSESKQAS